MIRWMMAWLLVGSMAFWSVGCGPDAPRDGEPGSPPDRQGEPGS